MDALQSKVKSLNGNSYANLFTNGKYTRVYPTAGKSSREFADSLTDFTDDVGIPNTVYCNWHQNMLGNGRQGWLSGKFRDIFGIMGLFIAQKSVLLSQEAMMAGPGWKKTYHRRLRVAGFRVLQSSLVLG